MKMLNYKIATVSVTLLSLFIFYSAFANTAINNKINHKIENGIISVNSPFVTDYVILHLSKDGALKGGYFMNKISNGNFSLFSPIDENQWNEYKFAYMTNEGQKESIWYNRDFAEETQNPGDQNQSEENLFPVKIINLSGKADSEVYLAVIGRLPENEDVMAYLDFTSSTLTPIKVSDNDPSNSMKSLKYNARLNSLTKTSENTYKVNLPRIVSGRMYISIDSPLPFHVNREPNGLAEPTAAIESQVTSSVNIIYDIVEMTWKPNENLFVNTSNVDFFSIPFTIQMNMKNGSEIVRGYNLSRSEIFTKAETLGEPWGKCIVRDNQGNAIRLLGGTLGTNTSAIPSDYYKSSIDKAWTALKSQPFNTAFQGWNVSGQAGADNLLHVTASHNSFGNESFTIPKPSSLESFAGDGVLARGSIIERKVQAFIAAAINRGVLYNPNLWWDRGSYYKNNSLNNGRYNKYAELLHSVSIEGRCYGFSYDDVNGQDSSIWEPDQKELLITIPSLTGQVSHTNSIVTENDQAETVQNKPVVIDVLQNDFCRLGNPLTVTAVTNPSNGNISISNSLITYAPNKDFFGSDIFSYTVENGFSDANATVSITIEKSASGGLSYSLENGHITLNSSEVTDYVIVHLAKDGAIQGGYFMNKDGSGVFSIAYPLSVDKWNKLRFVYMTKEGQKESQWFNK